MSGCLDRTRMRTTVLLLRGLPTARKAQLPRASCCGRTIHSAVPDSHDSGEGFLCQKLWKTTCGNNSSVRRKLSNLGSADLVSGQTLQVSVVWFLLDVNTRLSRSEYTFRTRKNKAKETKMNHKQRNDNIGMRIFVTRNIDLLGCHVIVSISSINIEQ